MPDELRRDNRSSLRRTFSWHRLREEVIRGGLFCCALLSVMTTLAIIFVLFTEALFTIPPHTAFFQDVSVREFFLGAQWSPQYDPPHYGIAPADACGHF